MSRITSHRTARALRSNYARGVYLGYVSAYREAAREQGVKPNDRYTWLCTYEVRNRLQREGNHCATGAGVLAFTNFRAPLDVHDAALRTLAAWAPGLGLDMLAARETLTRVYRDHGLVPPSFRIRHARGL